MRCSLLILCLPMQATERDKLPLKAAAQSDGVDSSLGTQQEVGAGAQGGCACPMPRVLGES
jgi:hypothetical protein